MLLLDNLGDFAQEADQSVPSLPRFPDDLAVELTAAEAIDITSLIS